MNSRLEHKDDGFDGGTRARSAAYEQTNNVVAYFVVS